MVNTPLPIFIKAPGDLGVAKAKLRYKPFGGTEWASVDMKKVEGGYAGVVPCAELTTTGKLRFYVIVMDNEGVPVATAGSLKEPYVVNIKSEIEGDQPSLPGQEPPQKCSLKEDCPPNFPGCGKGKGGKRGTKGWGASCEATQECTSGYVCLNGACEEGKGEEGEEGGGGEPSDKLKKNWISVGAQFDLMALTSATNVCGAYTVTNDGSRLKLKQVGDVYDNYFCYYPDGGGEYLGAPRENIDNEIQGGLGFAGVRILAGYDRVLWKGLVAGVRLGYSIGGQPAPGDTVSHGLQRQPSALSYMPFHGEARLAYYSLPDPVDGDQVSRLRPYGFIGGGVANAGSGVSVSVCDQLSKDTGEQIATSGDRSCKNQTGTKRTLDAYQVSGLGFVAAGGGLQWAFIDNFGVNVEVKMMFMVPTFGFVLSPSIAPVVMF